MGKISSLSVLVFALALAVPASAQDVGDDPTYGSVELNAGFTPDPWAKHLTAGGGVSVSRGSCSYGYVAEAPDVDLYWEGSGSTLYVYVIGKNSDTTLLVNTPDGNWSCDDDSFGDTDPILVIPKASSGLYNIWVGTYGSDTVGATLFVSEIDPRDSLGDFFDSAERIEW